MKNRMSPTEFPLKDLTVLDEVRKVFHETTGLAISFQYPGENSYDFYPRNERNTYCEAIQSSVEGMKRCLESDRCALCEARNSGEGRMYTCHAGLVNAVVPLVYKGREIGAMFTGQVFTREQTDADFSRVWEELGIPGLDKEKIRSEFFRVKAFDVERLQLGVRLITFMANYIISVEDEMSLQAEVYRKEQQILRYENERMQLQNDLQSLSIMVLQDKVGLKTEQQGEQTQSQQKQAIIVRAQDFIKRNYHQVLTLGDVAHAVYLSPNYFSTMFKEITGQNFSNYLNAVRIQEGKRLLRETDLPIKQIVHMVGFEDYNYFNRVFRKAVNLPPATYRDMFGVSGHDAS